MAPIAGSYVPYAVTIRLDTNHDYVHWPWISNVGCNPILKTQSELWYVRCCHLRSNPTLSLTSTRQDSAAVDGTAALSAIRTWLNV